MMMLMADYKINKYSQDKFKGQNQLSRSYKNCTSPKAQEHPQKTPILAQNVHQKFGQRFSQPFRGIEVFTQWKQGLGPK